MMATAIVPAFDVELPGNNQQVVDVPIARIVAHDIQQFGPLVHGYIVSYPILRINLAVELFEQQALKLYGAMHFAYCPLHPWRRTRERGSAR
jgi:hypothetical protein